MSERQSRFWIRQPDSRACMKQTTGLLLPPHSSNELFNFIQLGAEEESTSPQKIMHWVCIGARVWLWQKTVQQVLTLKCWSTFRWAQESAVFMLLTVKHSVVLFFRVYAVGFCFDPSGYRESVICQLFSHPQPRTDPQKGKLVTQVQLLACLSVLSSPRTDSLSEKIGNAPGGCCEALM